MIKLKLTSLLVILAAFGGAAVLAQSSPKPSIAVIPFAASGKANSAGSTELTNSLIDELVERGVFTVVDRSKSAAIDSELLEALKGSINQATAAAIGNKTGAQFLVLGSVTEFGEYPKGSFVVSMNEAAIKFNLRVVDSSTAEILFSRTFDKRSTSIGAPKSGMFTAIETKAMRDVLAKVLKETVDALEKRLGSMAAASPPPPPAVTNAVSVASSVNCSQKLASKPPRIMVVIPEVHIQQKIPDPAGETEIIKQLVNRGFNVVDQGQIAAIRDREKVLAALKNVQAAVALAVEFRADIIIVGEAFSERASSNGNLISTRARVEARAIQTDTARILAADGKFGSGLDIGEFVSAKAALRNAGTQWADYFFGQFCQTPVATRTEFPTNSVPVVPAGPMVASVEVMISNVDFAQAKTIADRIKMIAGVKNITKTQTGNIARLDVEYSGNAEKLADAISETRFGVMKINIVGLTGNKIEIAVGK